MHASLNHRPSVFTPVQAQQPNRTETYTFGNRTRVTDKCTISAPVHRAHATEFWNAPKEAESIGSSFRVPPRRPGFQELNSHGPGFVKTHRSLLPQVRS
jgi:hypothetical protein